MGIFDGVRSYPKSRGNFGQFCFLIFSSRVSPFCTKTCEFVPLRPFVQIKKNPNRTDRQVDQKNELNVKIVRSYPG